MLDSRVAPLSGRPGRWLVVVVACLLSVVLATQKRGKLSLWIDEKQVTSFIGMKIDIYVVKDGDVAPYLKQPSFAENLPSIPSLIDTVNLTWTAGDRHFTYWFYQLQSLDTRILFDPLLSIPDSGTIPSKTTIFQMAIPCTGTRKGVATLVLGLEIYDSLAKRIPGSPIKLKLRKHCRLHAASRLCRKKCKNNGRCNRIGECECKQGFYGEYCQTAMCFPRCKNNGSCEPGGMCRCKIGFEGRYCETALCSKRCQNGGYCVERGVCWCSQGFYGDTCQYSECKSPCANGGTCVGPDKCRCTNGFKGGDCSTAVTCRRSCGEHGVCVLDNKCSCHSGWRGRTCQKKKRRRRSHGRRNARNGKTRRLRKLPRRRKGRKKGRSLLKAVVRFGRRNKSRKRRGRRHRAAMRRKRLLRINNN